MYPVVPGHEIVGEVISIGPKVCTMKIGDNVAVGWVIDACLTCDTCYDGSEHYCEEGPTHTFNSMKRK